jgi:hypothetical protein
MCLIHAMFLVAMAAGTVLQTEYSGEWNKKSTLQAGQPVEIPGMVLKPGTYTIKLHESSNRRSIVQIWNQDESLLLATVLTVPDHRMRETDAVFTYHAARGDARRLLRSWYYPGDLNGLEFVYPKKRAKEIAKLTETHIMASNCKDMKQDAIVAMTPAGIEVVIDEPRQAQVTPGKPR